RDSDRLHHRVQRRGNAAIVESDEAVQRSGAVGCGESRIGAAMTIPIVFVLDDDISVRESLELLIRTAGRHAETFASAREFFAYSPVDVPHCLILDVALPDLNGLDVQRRFADRKEMPIIFITGYGDVPTTVEAMKAGAVEFLTKPFSDVILLDAIGKAIDRSRQIQSLRSEERRV